MSVKSQRLTVPTSIPPGTTVVVYTVPAGRTAIVRSCFLTNISAVNASPISLRVATFDFWQDSVGARSSVQPGYFVLNPGDKLAVVNGDLAATIRATLYGSLLVGAPV